MGRLAGGAAPHAVAGRVNDPLLQLLHFASVASRRSNRNLLKCKGISDHEARSRCNGSMDMNASKQVRARIETLRVLIVDDDQYMRKVVRTMLAAIGIRTVFEANDGMSGLDAICKHSPDIVLVDWEMPMIDGAQFVRMVRAPGEFPVPDVPIIMLTGHADRWRVLEAARLGAHEYLLKPVSTKALHDRIISILGNPRPTVKLDGYYGPYPRRLVVLGDEAAPVPTPVRAAVSAPRPAPASSPPPAPEVRRARLSRDDAPSNWRARLRRLQTH
jgi:CheY-like chemotaxis protein